MKGTKSRDDHHLENMAPVLDITITGKEFGVEVVLPEKTYLCRWGGMLPGARGRPGKGVFFMLLTVLGCWAPYPRAGGACSGYLVRDGEVNIMLDAGNGAFSNLCRHIDFKKLDVLVLSHLHPDHFVDLYCLQHAMDWAVKEKARPGPLKVYMPPEPTGVFNTFREKGGLDVSSYRELPRDSERGIELYRAKVKGVRLEFLAVPHSMPAYAVSVKGEETKMVFSGDCAPNDGLVALAQGADLYLSEGSGLDGDARYLSGVHHTARQAGETARRAGVKRLLVTHFWPEHPVEEIIHQAGEGFGGPVEPAIENKSYQI